MEEWERAKTQCLLFQVAVGSQVLQRIFIFIRKPETVLIENLTCLSDRCPAAASVEKLYIQLFFQLHDLFGESGLGDVELFSCLKKMYYFLQPQ